MKAEIVSSLIFSFGLLPSAEKVCSDIRNFPNLVNNYTIQGPFLRVELVDGLLHCVEECKLVTRCKAVSFNVYTGMCTMYPLAEYSSAVNTGSLLFWANKDWTKQIVQENSGESSQRKGFDCYFFQGSHGFYNGTVNVTMNGSPCQMWSKQAPQIHRVGINAGEFTTGESMDQLSNYCRVPVTDKTTAPWCYTENFNKRWGRCDIPECSATIA